MIGGILGKNTLGGDRKLPNKQALVAKKIPRKARRINPESNSQYHVSPTEKREFPAVLRLTPHTLNLRQTGLFQPPAHINSHAPKHRPSLHC